MVRSIDRVESQRVISLHTFPHRISVKSIRTGISNSRQCRFSVAHNPSSRRFRLLSRLFRCTPASNRTRGSPHSSRSPAPKAVDTRRLFPSAPDPSVPVTVPGSDRPDLRCLRPIPLHIRSFNTLLSPPLALSCPLLPPSTTHKKKEEARRGFLPFSEVSLTIICCCKQPSSR